MSFHLQQDRSQRVALTPQIGRAIASEHHQRKLGDALGQVSDQLTCCEVAPLQIFEQDADRIAPADLLERVGKLSAHSFLTASHQLRFEAFPRGAVAQRGGEELCEPGRCFLLQNRPEQRSVSRPAQLGQRIEERQVGLTGAQTLRAPSGRDHRTAVFGERGNDVLDQCRLSGSCLSGDHDKGPRSRRGL